MSYKKKLILILILFQIIGSNTMGFEAIQEDTQEPCKILFIGHSYFNWYNLPGIFENLSINAEKDVFVDRYCVNGVSLYEHASRSATDSKIKQKDWDYVVLIDSGVSTAYPEEYPDEPLIPALITLEDKISSNCNSTTMIYCMPWAFENGYGWNGTFESMQIEIYEQTLQISEDLNLTISPVGWAWYTVLKNLKYPPNYLHVEDESHPSLKGTYLMACTIYSTIFREPATGIPFYSDMTKINAKYFQNVATNTVMDNLELWNIDPLPLDNNSSIPGFNTNSLLLFTIIGLSIIIFIRRKFILTSLNE